MHIDESPRHPMSAMLRSALPDDQPPRPRTGGWLGGGEGLRANRSTLALVCALGLLALARLASLGLYPLMDATEARYADIARRMLERADWITPWFTDTQPFWGKPVLSFWATAAGFEVFGTNEFGARAPHFILGLALAAMVWKLGRKHSARHALHSVALLAGCVLFTVSSGAVMTDMALALGTTMAMGGFWACAGRGETSLAARAALFVGLAIGLLAKGPIALVLCGVPIAAWALWQRRVRDAWTRVPWLWGLVLVVAMVAPWYAAAEWHTPGFLRYFIVGEHWQRFLTPGWAGDLYGSAHNFPRGSIWVFALVAAAPWILLLPLAVAAGRGEAPGLPASERRYLLLWMLWPCAFFTVAGNILWTYVLPSLPAFALLAGSWTAKAAHAQKAERIMAAVLVALALLIPVLVVAGDRGGLFARSSEKSLVRAWDAAALPGQALLEVPHPAFSTRFYTSGRAGDLPDPLALRELPVGQVVFVLISPARLEALPEDMRQSMAPVAATAKTRLVRWRRGV